MERKVSLHKNARWFMGVCFLSLGAPFLLIGIFTFPIKDAKVFSLAFALTGMMLLIPGIIFLVKEWKQLQIARQLLASGRYVWGEVSEIYADSSIRINGRNPYIVTVLYVDPSGCRHLFKSRSMKIRRADVLPGAKVKVYYEDDSFRDYHVDLSDAMVQMIEH